MRIDFDLSFEYGHFSLHLEIHNTVLGEEIIVLLERTTPYYYEDKHNPISVQTHSHSVTCLNLELYFPDLQEVYK